MPDDVAFESWDNNPQHVLPESDPTTFTHLIDLYFRERTTLSLNLASGLATGRLVGSNREALSAAPIALSLQPISGPGISSSYTLSGTVPSTIGKALVQICVNECGSESTNDINVYSLQYSDSSNQTSLNFSDGVNGWGVQGGWGAQGMDPTLAQVQLVSDSTGSSLHLVSTSSQHTFVNSPSFAVAQSAPYQLTVQARISPASVGSGYFALIFLDATTGHESSRQTLAFQAATLPVGIANTISDGSYSLSLPVEDPNYVIEAQYAGTDTYWPAIANPVQPFPVVTSVINAASSAAGAIAPGEIVAIKGITLGPAPGVSYSVDPITGMVDSTLAATKVFFGAFAAPITYSSATQINAIVPYEVSGQSQVVMQVRYKGVASGNTTLGVASATPAAFTFNATGTGQAVAANQDYSFNGSSNPAVKGSYVTIYFTGGGQTSPSGVTGSVNGSALKWLAQTASVTVGGQPAIVSFDGAAPTFVDGVGQLNIQLSANTPSGPAEPLVITVGGVSSPATATLAIQ